MPGDRSLSEHKEVVSSEAGRAFLGGVRDWEGPAMYSGPAILVLDLAASI